MNKILRLAGIFIFISFVLSIFSYFAGQQYLILAGIMAWIALVMMFGTLKKKKMLNIFLALSVINFSISYYNHFYIDFIRAFTVNQYLLALLIGVGFLRLITSPKKDFANELPQGKQSFLKTYFSLHLFGSVINMSSIILVGDKLYKKSPLSNSQIVLLTRAFATDALWSPFFVAFAAVITYAPHVKTSIILVAGLGLAIVGFLITYRDIVTNPKLEIEKFLGYPMSYDSLYLPFALAVLVLVSNHFFPHIKIIILIPVFSIILVLFVLLAKKGETSALHVLSNHILHELPNMKSEISLFLIAGMFGVSAGSILAGVHVALPFEHFDWIAASGLLAMFIVLSFIGVHPIITIATLGSILSHVNHTLLAAVVLMAWSTSVCTSPFSGVNLTLVSRYDLDGVRIFKLNIGYTLKMYVAYVFCLFLISTYLHL
ncbi:MAG: tellurium resistance protein TerC [Sulfurospirillaceae bacterium]|nr:tellurium resistance protein TerC [Sulfurospirillaceae bacterium]